MERTNKILFRREVFGPSFACSGNPKCKCGIIRSITRKNIPPSKKPTRAGTKENFPKSLLISIAGARSDQKLAASITPAAKPSIILPHFLFKFLKKNTSEAPAAVQAHVKIPARSANSTGFSDDK